MGKKIFAIAILAIMWFTTVALAQQKDFTLTKQGVGPIKFGMRLEQIPAKYEGLYTHFKKTIVECGVGGKYIDYIFYYGNSKVMEITQFDDTGDTTISNVTCFSPRIKATNGMYAGMSSIELYNRKAEVYGDAKIVFFVGDYCFVTPLSASGEKKASDAYMSGKAEAIASSDFPKGAKITEMSISNRR